MFEYSIELLENGAWSELGFWVRPFYDTQTLDDSLDTGKIKVSLSTRSKTIKPFTRLRIFVYDHDELVDTIHRVVGSTKKIRRTFPNGKSLFDWEIETIELTKLLEREVCDSMTVTNYLGHNYEAGAFLVAPVQKFGLHVDITSAAPIIYTPTPLFTSISLCSVRDLIVLNVSDMTAGNIKLQKPDYSEIVLVDNYTSGYNLTLGEPGSYILKYYGEYYTAGQGPLTFQIEYYFVAGEADIPPRTDYTITDVVNRLLSAGITRRSGIDSQKYIFDSVQSAKYSTVLAPEFFFTRQTLFEALLQVGAYIHAIPRLNDVGGVLTLSFDELGGDTVKELEAEFIYDEMNYGVDDYCGAIDSPVDNLLNSRDKVQGAIIEPSTGAYKTIRCEKRR